MGWEVEESVTEREEERMRERGKERERENERGRKKERGKERGMQRVRENESVYDNKQTFITLGLWNMPTHQTHLKLYVNTGIDKSRWKDR